MVRRLAQLGQRDPSIDTLRQHYLGSRLNMRFQTVKDDQPLLEDLVFGGTAHASKKSRAQERLIDAGSYLAKVLSKENAETLVNWSKTLASAHITYFPVNDKVQASQIFTLQNSRGKELTEFEKLKAFLMHQIYLTMPSDKANRAIERVEQHFSVMYREMECIRHLDENGVLRHHDQAYSSHSDSPANNLKKGIDAISEPEDKVAFIVQYCKQLAATFGHVIKLENLISRQELVADPIILDGSNSWPLLD